MQKLLASILIIAFASQTFNQGCYYLAYLVEKKEYMKRCVNKARPKMHCNGKCQMMKKMEEQEKKEQGQLPEMKFAAKIDISSFRSSLQFSFNFLEQINNTHFFAFNSGIPVDQSSPIFHPPPAC